jgi:hypothetical protein
LNEKVSLACDPSTLFGRLCRTSIWFCSFW